MACRSSFRVPPAPEGTAAARRTTAASRKQAVAPSSETRGDIVILGAGLVGAATAYALSLEGASVAERVTLVERSDSPAAAASGKGGGFIARNWGGRGPTGQLHERGFELHKRVAKTLGVSSYRGIKTLSVSAGSGGGARRAGGESVDWLDGARLQRIDFLDDVTAQVDPRELTEKLIEAAVGAGVTLRTCTQAVGIDSRVGGDGSVREPTGVRCRTTVSESTEEDILLQAEHVVCSMGPWAVQAQDWFDVSIPLTGIKSTSMIFENDERVEEEPRALFCDEDDDFGTHLEVYPRRSELYVCGIGGSDYVSADRLMNGGDCDRPSKILPDPARVSAGRSAFASISSVGERAPIRTQACMRPCAPDALPLLGFAPGWHNAIIATGMNCWGITWSLAVGEAVKELVLDGKSTTFDLTAFSPHRFMKTTSGRGRRKDGMGGVGEQW